MTVILLRILFFFLVPLGIFFIVKGIKLARKAFSGAILLEIPYSQRTGQFTIAIPGEFTIWQKGKFQKRGVATNLQPIIRHAATQQEVPIYRVRSQIYSNNGSVGRLQLFSFSARDGSYTLELSEGSGQPNLESFLTRVIPQKPLDLSKYFIQVSKRQPTYFIVFGVLLILLGAFATIGGMAGIAAGFHQ
jgi:hypothetical protein